MPFVETRQGRVRVEIEVVFIAEFLLDARDFALQHAIGLLVVHGAEQRSAHAPRRQRTRRHRARRQRASFHHRSGHGDYFVCLGFLFVCVV